jgi:hypothetical protein
MLRTHIAVWLTLAVIAFYYLGYFLFGADPPKRVFDALVVGVSVSVCMTWFSNSWRAFKSGVRDGTGNIMVSTWGTWTLLLAYFLWVVLFTWAGRPDSWRESPVPGTLSCCFFLMGSYALLTPVNNSGQPIPRVGLAWWFVAVAVGGVVAGVIMTLSFTRIFDISQYG